MDRGASRCKGKYDARLAVLRRFSAHFRKTAPVSAAFRSPVRPRPDLAPGPCGDAGFPARRPSAARRGWIARFSCHPGACVPWERCEWVELPCFPNTLFAHDLVRIPVPTFRDHARALDIGGCRRPARVVFRHSSLRRRPPLWQFPPAFGPPFQGRFRSHRCRSSVVEHSLGKGEVESSILSGSTISVSFDQHLGREHSPSPRFDGAQKSNCVAERGENWGTVFSRVHPAWGPERHAVSQSQTGFYETPPHPEQTPKGRTIKLKQRIVELASAQSDTRAAMLTELIAALHEADDTEFKAAIQEGHVSSRRAYYLLKVGRLLRRGIITRADVEKAGWTRVAIVAPMMDRRNAARLVRQAKTPSAKELTRIIRDGDENEPRPNCVQLHLSDQQYRRLKAALEKAGVQRARSEGQGGSSNEHHQGVGKHQGGVRRGAQLEGLTSPHRGGCPRVGPTLYEVRKAAR